MDPIITIGSTVIVNTPRGRAAAIVTTSRTDGKLDLAVIYPGESTLFPLADVERARTPIAPGWMTREQAETPAE